MGIYTEVTLAFICYKNLCYYVNGRREKRVWLTGGSGFDIEIWATLIQGVQDNE